MKTMAITDFKTHALQVLEEVAETREPVVVTIVSPLGEEIWNACR